MTQLTGWDKKTSPYHRGEQELQQRLGLKEQMEPMARKILRPFIPDQHREFYSQLPFLIAGSVDSGGWPWASILFGVPGFISTPSDRRLLIDVRPVAGDPIAANTAPGSPLGLLGIEMPTRRRNRVNGVIAAGTDSGLAVDVVQSFGNCPQYIQTRSMSFIRDPAEPLDTDAARFETLDDDAIRMISSADTFFVASYNNEDDSRDTGGVDVSHRGGQPGFVKVDGDTLTIPDYVGNFAFNTLGNFLVNPKAGLLFIDFETGDLLLLTGTTELLWDETPEVKSFRGAERAWRFTLERGLRLKNASPLRWSFGEYSPNTLLTGNWDQAAKSFAAEQKRELWQPYRIIRIADESPAIRSFYLESADGDALPDYQPGQFLTVRATPAGAANPMIRTYTLSSSPVDKLYRISVKRDGVMSSHLHSTLKPGDIIEAKAPRGLFVFDTQVARPAVLIAGGVGVTPMISMARAVVSDRVRLRYARELTVIHAARTAEDLAFRQEFKSIETDARGLCRYVSLVSQPTDTDKASRVYDFSGRLTSLILQKILPSADYEFYLCGPGVFMQSVYDMLLGLGVADKRILTESFGPSSLSRRLDSGEEEEAISTSAEEAEAALVTFATSKFEQAWTPEQGTLLEFAENHGLAPDYACRNGICGTCAVKLRAGEVFYRTSPNFKPAGDEVLICCATPAQGSDSIVLDL